MVEKNDFCSLSGDDWWWVRFTNTRADDCLGFCDYDAKTIYLDTGLDGEILFSTLLHELLHRSLPGLTEVEILRVEREICPVLVQAAKTIGGG